MVVTSCSYKRVCVAGPSALLAPLVDPKVGNPLGPRQHRAGRVPRQLVPLPVLVEVVPEGSGALLGPEGDAELGEDGGAALLHVARVDEQGGDTVT